MLRITIEVDVPAWMGQGIKETFAMYLERYGDARVVSIEENGSGQTRMGGFA